MKRTLLLILIAAFMLTSCMVMSDSRKRGRHSQDAVVLVPALPSVVVLEAEPYYHHSGYYYHYTKDRWYYSKSKKGPWHKLPKDHYPKKVQFKDKERKRYEEERSREHDHDHDNEHHQGY
ncbi:conserved exported hypothetical protein [uncultured Desulfobacterium sp.]|uniref:Lipoprotein n=1 Tax=uncultured Desulfobacterium sp. TaxID=201089 RepID=A0A445N2I2_9BACT|nr:conserved exported hypothetical protein [uncultured Desulfobacterium sp.]